MERFDDAGNTVLFVGPVITTLGGVLLVMTTRTGLFVLFSLEFTVINCVKLVGSCNATLTRFCPAVFCARANADRSNLYQLLVESVFVISAATRTGLLLQVIPVSVQLVFVTEYNVFVTVPPALVPANTLNWALLMLLLTAVRSNLK